MMVIGGIHPTECDTLSNDERHATLSSIQPRHHQGTSFKTDGTAPPSGSVQFPVNLRFNNQHYLKYRRFLSPGENGGTGCYQPANN
jgi:hypothetical protein